jgi:hypothetical protein
MKAPENNTPEAASAADEAWRSRLALRLEAMRKEARHKRESERPASPPPESAPASAP